LRGCHENEIPKATQSDSHSNPPEEASSFPLACLADGYLLLPPHLPFPMVNPLRSFPLQIFQKCLKGHPPSPPHRRYPDLYPYLPPLSSFFPFRRPQMLFQNPIFPCVVFASPRGIHVMVPFFSLSFFFLASYDTIRPAGLPCLFRTGDSLLLFFYPRVITRLPDFQSNNSDFNRLPSCFVGFLPLFRGFLPLLFGPDSPSCQPFQPFFGSEFFDLPEDPRVSPNTHFSSPPFLLPPVGSLIFFFFSI